MKISEAIIVIQRHKFISYELDDLVWAQATGGVEVKLTQYYESNKKSKETDYDLRSHRRALP